MADERPETMYPDDNGHLYENNRQIHPSQPDLPPRVQPATSVTPHHLPAPPSQQNLTTDCQPAFQPPPPGYTYPQPPPPGAMGYYPPQPGPYPGYPPQYPQPAGYLNCMPPQQQQQQQQQQIVIHNAAQPTMIVQAPPVKSYCGDIVLACFVFWCCGWLFGLIAFILAVMANNMPYGTQSEQLSRASRGVSIAGIIVGVIIIAVVIGVSVGGGSYKTSSSSSSGTYCAYYKVNGICYTYRSYTNSYDCYYNHYNAAYANNYCYYNY